MRKGAVIGLALFVAPAALAEPVKLVGPAIEAAVRGAVIEIDTPIGTTVPVRYGTDGRVSGKAGSVAFFLGAAEDEGRWWVEQGYKLCHKWNRWFDGDEFCLVLKRDGDILHWRNGDGDTGTATIVKKAEPRPAIVAAATPKPAPARKAVPAKPVPVMAAAMIPATTPATPAAATATDVSPKTAAADTPKAAEPTATAPAIAKPAPTTSAAATVKTKPAAKTNPPKTPPTPVALTKPDLTKPDLTKPATTPSAADPTFRVTMVEPGDVLWIRQGPSMHHVPVGSIPHRGRGVAITGACRGEWCPVRFAGYKGWANHWYLEPDPPHMARLEQAPSARK